MIKETVFKSFDTPSALEQQLASKIASQLQEAVDARGKASLVVSGGSTPLKLFELLSMQSIDWSDVYITLADERWVDVEDSASNERLVREHLLQNRAANAKFTRRFARIEDWLRAAGKPAWAKVCKARCSHTSKSRMRWSTGESPPGENLTSTGRPATGNSSLLRSAPMRRPLPAAHRVPEQAPVRARALPPRPGARPAARRQHRQPGARW